MCPGTPVEKHWIRKSLSGRQKIKYNFWSTSGTSEDGRLLKNVHTPNFHKTGHRGAHSWPYLRSSYAQHTVLAPLNWVGASAHGHERCRISWFWGGKRSFVGNVRWKPVVSLIGQNYRTFSPRRDRTFSLQNSKSNN